MKVKLAGAALRLVAMLPLAEPALADPSPRIDNGTDFYLSLGDSAAAGTDATGVGSRHGHGVRGPGGAPLAHEDPRFELVKLGCPGESAASMRLGLQPPTTVLSCRMPS
jgi:hypothetical protein